MALSPEAQFKKILARSEHILILLPENPTTDHLAAGYGLTFFCKTFGTDTTIAFSDPHHSRDTVAFLPQPEKLLTTLSGTRDFIISLDTKHNSIDCVRTERDGDILTIHLTPERGRIDSRDLSFGLAPFAYDVLITLGAPNKDVFGALNTEVPDIFYDLPIINIDHKSDNEHYGTLDLITLTASSTTEAVSMLCTKVHPESITAVVAECFLTGIIAVTDSFRSPRTTPHTLSLASTFIDKGADQQKIVTHLYKSQPLTLLKLWGAALRNLQKNTTSDIITTILKKEDFTTTKTEPHYLPTIIEKIKQNHASGKIFAIIYEDDNGCHALLDTTHKITLLKEICGAPTENGLYVCALPENEIALARENITKKLAQLPSL